jgi:hypothetical protein
MNASKIGNYNAMNRIAKTSAMTPQPQEKAPWKKQCGGLYSIAAIHYSE